MAPSQHQDPGCGPPHRPWRGPPGPRHPLRPPKDLAFSRKVVLPKAHAKLAASCAFTWPLRPSSHTPRPYRVGPGQTQRPGRAADGRGLVPWEGRPLSGPQLALAKAQLMLASLGGSAWLGPLGARTPEPRSRPRRPPPRRPPRHRPGTAMCRALAPWWPGLAAAAASPAARPPGEAPPGTAKAKGLCRAAISGAWRILAVAKHRTWRRPSGDDPTAPCWQPPGVRSHRHRRLKPYTSRRS